MRNYDDISKILNKFIKDNEIKFVMAKSPIQEPDHITQQRVNRMNNGLFS
jgi:hypothetical protein